MAKTIQLRNLLSNSQLDKKQIGSLVAWLVLAVFVFVVARIHDLWPLAVAAILVIEIGLVWRGKQVRTWTRILPHVPAIVVGSSIAVIITVTPRELSQLALAVVYGVWRWQWKGDYGDGRLSLIQVLGAEIVGFWAIFLMSAEWRTYEWLVLLLVWACAYVPTVIVLRARKERMAPVLASAWALVATEVSWVLIRWLFVYVVPSGYLLIPQAVVVLGGLGYVFGNIYLAQREGKLSRSRLTEYLLIGMILIAVVITGTPWHGNL